MEHGATDFRSDVARLVHCAYQCAHTILHEQEVVRPYIHSGVFLIEIKFGRHPVRRLDFHKKKKFFP